MTEILCVGDLHLSDRPPTNCTDSYNDQLFEMLWEIVAMVEAHQPDAVVFAGDLFHLKQANRTSYRTMQRMIEVVQAFDSPVYLVVGNHDITNDRIESIYETQPFGVLLKSGAHLLHGWAEGGKLPLYGVPWQQDWNGDYSGDFLSWITEVDARHDGNALLVTHAPIYPPGEELPWENVPASHIALTMGQVGYCYYGHVHDLHGTFEVDGVTFCNQGALSRGSLHESDLSRCPAVTVWRSDRSGAEAFHRVELTSARSASEVFRLAEAADRADYQGRLDAFLAAVSASTVEVASIESVLAKVRSMGLSSAETQLAEDVLVEASHKES